MKNARFLMCSVFAVIGVLAACRGDRNYTVKNREGIRVVHNRRPKSSRPEARLEFVRKIGDLNADDENLKFVFPIHAARDGEGHLFILDSQDHCIKKFERDGRYILKFGRHGQGPGEFQSPMALGIGNDNRLFVQCMDSTFQIFDLNGRYIHRFTVGRYDGLYMKIMNSGQVVGYAMNPGGKNSSENKVIKILDLEGKTVNHFGTPLLLSDARHSWGVNFLNLAIDPEDNIYASFAFQNRIEKYSPGGKLLMTIDRDLSYPVEHRFVKETMEILGQTREIDRLRSTNVSRGIGMDAQDRIWVLAYAKNVPEIKNREEFTPQEYNIFEVYDVQGILLYHVPVPELVPSFDNWVMAGDTIYFIDPYGQCCVFEFRIAAE